MWTVVYLPEAEPERNRLSARERSALYNAVAKLQTIGPNLGYPHSSAVRDADRLREQRPRAGRSPIRALYRQVGDFLVIAAISRRRSMTREGSRRRVGPPPGDSTR